MRPNSVPTRSDCTEDHKQPAGLGLKYRKTRTPFIFPFDAGRIRPCGRSVSSNSRAFQRLPLVFLARPQNSRFWAARSSPTRTERKRKNETRIRTTPARKIVEPRKRERQRMKEKRRKVERQKAEGCLFPYRKARGEQALRSTLRQQSKTTRPSIIYRQVCFGFVLR